MQNSKKDLLLDLQGALGKHSGNESDTSKTMGIMGVVLLEILEGMERLSSSEAEDLEKKIQQIETIKKEIAKHIPTLCEMKGDIIALEEEINASSGKNKKTLPCFEYIEDSKYTYSQLLGTLKTIIDFFQILDTPLQDLGDTLKSIGESDKIITKEEKQKIFFKARDEISTLEGSIQKIGRSMRGFLEQVSLVEGYINQLYLQAESHLKSEEDDAEDGGFASMFGRNKEDHNGYILYKNLLLTQVMKIYFLKFLK